MQYTFTEAPHAIAQRQEYSTKRQVPTMMCSLLKPPKLTHFYILEYRRFNIIPFRSRSSLCAPLELRRVDCTHHDQARDDKSCGYKRDHTDTPSAGRELASNNPVLCHQIKSAYSQTYAPISRRTKTFQPSIYQPYFRLIFRWLFRRRY